MTVLMCKWSAVNYENNYTPSHTDDILIYQRILKWAKMMLTLLV